MSSSTGTYINSLIPVDTTWNGGLVFLSYVISCLGSASSLVLFKSTYSNQTIVSTNRAVRYRFFDHPETLKWIYMISSSICLGGVGIWSMHFVGMLALTLQRSDTGANIQFAFDPGLTALSFFNAVLIVLLGFWIIDSLQRKKSLGILFHLRFVIGGVVAGSGVSVMHYVGMFAMVSDAHITWDVGIIIASVCIGIFAATVALLIFFHSKFHWTRSNVFVLPTAMIMGVAVCGMHYCGMQAASWSIEAHSNPTDLSSYATNTSLVAGIVPFAIFSCLILIILEYMLQRRRQGIIAIVREHTKLTLVSMCIDERNERILCLSSTRTPPSKVIADSYDGTFDRINIDFLRMLKLSFNWNSEEDYLSYLQSLSDNGKLNITSLNIFKGFISTSHAFASDLGLSISQLGVLYWNPSEMLICMIIDSRFISTSLTEMGVYEFMEYSKVDHTLLDRLPSNVSLSSFISSLLEYRRKVRMPIVDDQSREHLSKFLGEVAESLVGNDNDITSKNSLLSTEFHIDEDAKFFKNQLGKYVNSISHLDLLVNAPSNWTHVDLPPMVKSMMEYKLKSLPCYSPKKIMKSEEKRSVRKHSSSTKETVVSDWISTSENDGSSSINNNNTTISARLFIGFYFTQSSSANGTSVLVSSDGPYGFVPIFPCGSSKEWDHLLKWIHDIKSIRNFSRLNLVEKSSKILEYYSNHSSTVQFSYSLLKDFIDSISGLATKLGNSQNLTIDNFFPDIVLDLNTGMKVVLFAQSRLSHSQAIPPEFLSRSFQFVPLPLFEVIHSCTCPHLAHTSWVRKFLHRLSSNSNQHVFTPSRNSIELCSPRIEADPNGSKESDEREDLILNLNLSDSFGRQ